LNRVQLDPSSAHAEHDEADTTAIQVVCHPQQARVASGKTIGLAADRRVTAPNEAQSFLKAIALRHSGYLLREDIFASGCLQVSNLDIQASLLVTGRCSRVANRRRGQ